LFSKGVPAMDVPCGQSSATLSMPAMTPDKVPPPLQLSTRTPTKFVCWATP
jgi:hypothetical protein